MYLTIICFSTSEAFVNFLTSLYICEENLLLSLEGENKTSSY